MRFSKPPLSFQEQLDLLKRRGMAIADEPKALGCLGHLNYYRLRAYWIHMEGPKDPATGDHSFRPGARFEDALALYVFDRKLRLLVMDAVERIEVSIRTNWAYQLATRHGSHAYLDSAHFSNPVEHAKSLVRLSASIERSKEKFIKHYRDTYSDPLVPPIWAACEVMSFGELSKWVGNLKLRADRQAISSPYNLDEQILVSFLHHLATARNLCAHHSRLWNRRFTVTMKIPTGLPAELQACFNPAADRNLYNTLAMLALTLRAASPGSSWANRVKDLMLATPLADPAPMGFPSRWEKLTLWL